MLLTHATLAVGVLVTLISACTDLRSRTIPNWLTLPLIPLAILAHAVSSGLEAALLSALGCLLCALPTWFLFVRGALGGGDVKLFVGLGALLGPREGLEVMLSAFVLVSVYALRLTAWRGQLWGLLRSSYQATLHLLLPSRFACPASREHQLFELPMGLGIFVAMCALSLRGSL